MVDLQKNSHYTVTGIWYRKVHHVVLCCVVTSKYVEFDYKPLKAQKRTVNRSHHEDVVAWNPSQNGSNVA